MVLYIRGASVPQVCPDNRGLEDISLFFSPPLSLKGEYNSFASEIFFSVRTIQLRDK